MGNQNCVQINQHFEQNQAYGDFKIIKQNNRQMAVIEKILQNDIQLKQQVKEKLEIRTKLKSPHLAKLYHYYIDETKYSTTIKMYYECIQKTLQSRFHQKLSDQTEFTERQLFNIIYGVENALQQLQKYDIRHGCINLSTILCQGTFYKITDVSSTTFVKSYDLVRRGCRNQFLSQKLLTNLQYKSLEPFYELEDDLFSLGMIVLTLTSRVYPKHFYQWKEKQCTAELKWDNIETAIKRLQRTYSSKLSKKTKQLIGFGEQLNKSVETNSTTIFNNNRQSFSSKDHLATTKMQQITEEVNELDKHIDRILSRVNVQNSKSNGSGKSQYYKVDVIRRECTREQINSFESTSRIQLPQSVNQILIPQQKSLLMRNSVQDQAFESIHHIHRQSPNP